MVRLAPGSNELDPMTVSLNEVLSGVVGGLIPGADGSAYVRVLDTSRFESTPDATYLEVYSASAWATWRIDLLGAGLPVRVDRPPLAGGIKVFEVDGQAYENESAANFASTTLVRTTGEGAPARALTMPGATWGIVRLR
jgi:hypothetical protein